MRRPTHLYLNSRDEFYRVDISKIVYLEADGNYTNIVLNNKLTATICMNLSQMQNVLSDSLKDGDGQFARVGRSHIVNLGYVFHIAILRQKLILSDGVHFDFQLNVSKEALRKLRDLYVMGSNTTAEIPDAVACRNEIFLTT